MTFGPSDEANFTGEESALRSFLESACFLASIDATTEATLSDIVRKIAGQRRKFALGGGVPPPLMTVACVSRECRTL